MYKYSTETHTSIHDPFSRHIVVSAFVPKLSGWRAQLLTHSNTTHVSERHDTKGEVLLPRQLVWLEYCFRNPRLWIVHDSFTIDGDDGKDEDDETTTRVMTMEVEMIIIHDPCFNRWFCFALIWVVPRTGIPRGSKDSLRMWLIFWYLVHITEYEH